MTYKTYREEIKDKWRDLDLPVHEAIEVLRAALALKEEELQAKYEVQEQKFFSQLKEGYDTPQFWDLHHKFCDSYNVLRHMNYVRNCLNAVACDFYCFIIAQKRITDAQNENLQRLL